MPACFKPDQTLRHQQHIRVVDFHFTESRRLNLHDFTVDYNFANMLQSSPSALSNELRESILDSTPFSPRGIPPLAISV